MVTTTKHFSVLSALAADYFMMQEKCFTLHRCIDSGRCITPRQPLYQNAKLGKSSAPVVTAISCGHRKTQHDGTKDNKWNANEGWRPIKVKKKIT